MRQGNVSSSALDQWQNGVEAVRGQMDVLMRQNDQLTRAYDQDKMQERRLLATIDEQRKKIAALSDFLKQRAGKSDQQLRMDVLNDQLSIKRLQSNKILLDYKTQHAHVEAVLKHVEDKRLKVSAYELNQGDTQKDKKIADLPKDPALEQLRKDLERQKEAEARVAGEMDPSKTEGNPFEMAPLEAKLAALQSQKAILLRKPLVSPGPDKDKFYLMQAKKEELEVKIHGFERRIDAIKSSSAVVGSWSASRKEMVRAMSQGDARNKRLANEINDLKENIALLRTQIGVLEKRVLFSNRKKEY